MKRRIGRFVLACTLLAGTTARGADGPVIDKESASPRVFTVVFEGLMTHVGSMTHKTHVAVVAAHGHRAVLEVDDHLHIELGEGDVISFDLPPGDAAIDNAYQMTVPHLLSLIRDGSLRDSVLRALPDANVAAYLQYPAGVLTVESTYAHPVEYRFDDGGFAAKHCAALRVLFRAVTTQRFVTIFIERNGVTTTHRVRASSTIRVKNDPAVATSASHFPMYLALTDASRIADAVPDPLSTCSETLGEHALAGPRVRPNDYVPGCGNTQWP